MIYITGDCHGDWTRFSSVNFPEQKTMTRDDFVIVCGDFGLWHDNNSERWWLDWLSEKNFTLLFIDGNHENFDRLYGNEFETIEFYGGKAHRIRENIYHLIRGYVFELCGKKVFAFGGAESYDKEDGILEPNDYPSRAKLMREFNRLTKRGKMVRINHISWWCEEMPSELEMARGKEALARHDNMVDIIVTHCCPQTIITMFSNEKADGNSLTEFFSSIMNTANFSHWYFGHYHSDVKINDKFTLIYSKIERITY